MATNYNFPSQETWKWDIFDQHKETFMIIKNTKFKNKESTLTLEKMMKLNLVIPAYSNQKCS